VIAASVSAVHEWRLSPVGWYYLAVFCLLLPYLTIKSKRKLDGGHPLPPRRKHFVRTIVVLLVCLALSLWVADYEYVGSVFGEAHVEPGDVAWGAALLALAIGSMYPRWKKAVERRLPRLELFSPRGALELCLWIGVSAAAALSEEVTYRSVVFQLLWWTSDNAWLAALVSAAAFGAAHMVQGWKSALVIGVFALLMQGLVHVTGTLHVAIAVHFLYDVAAGVTYGRLIAARDARDAAARSA
jgi:membrane protease YdiL (CAAX protease family)